MDTTLVIKTNKKLRDEAKMIAGELGVPLTTVMNAFLKQFVRERKFSVSVDPVPTKSKLALWTAISAEMDKKSASARSFSNADDLLEYLRLP